MHIHIFICIYTYSHTCIDICKHAHVLKYVGFLQGVCVCRFSHLSCRVSSAGPVEAYGTLALVIDRDLTYLWLVGNGGMGYIYNYYYYHSSIPY